MPKRRWKGKRNRERRRCERADRSVGTLCDCEESVSVAEEPSEDAGRRRSRHCLKSERNRHGGGGKVTVPRILLFAFVKTTDVQRRPTFFFFSQGSAVKSEGVGRIWRDLWLRTCRHHGAALHIDAKHLGAAALIRSLTTWLHRRARKRGGFAIQFPQSSPRTENRTLRCCRLGLQHRPCI